MSQNLQSGLPTLKTHHYLEAERHKTEMRLYGFLTRIIEEYKDLNKIKNPKRIRAAAEKLIMVVNEHDKTA